MYISVFMLLPLNKYSRQTVSGYTYTTSKNSEMLW